MGGPVGLEIWPRAIGEEKDQLEDVIEPFLIQQGFLHAATSRPELRLKTSGFLHSPRDYSPS